MYDELVRRLHRYTENCVAYKLDADFADAVQLAAIAIEELSKQHEAQRQNLVAMINDRPKWINATEQLPENFGNYLVWVQEPVDWTTKRLSENAEEWENFDMSHVEYLFFNKDQKVWSDDDTPMNACLKNVNVHDAFHVTHWMPLPERPKDGEEW